RELLRDLLGAEELRDLLDPQALADLEAELQRLVPGRRARDADELHDLVRILGPLTDEELIARSEPHLIEPPGALEAALDQLRSERRLIDVTIGDRRCRAAAEDAGRL